MKCVPGIWRPTPQPRRKGLARSLANNERIPDAFDALQALSETRVHAILEKTSADHDAASEEGKIGAFYRAFMEERRADTLGAGPIQPELAAIRAADSYEKLWEVLATRD